MIYLVTNEPEKFTHMLDDTLALATVNDVLTYFKDKDELEFDTETMGFDPYTCQLLSAQFGDYTRQYVIDTLTVDITLFRTLLETKTILMQFAKFDLRFLYYYKIFPTDVYDTFLAEAVLYMGVKQHRKSLDVLVDRYCNVQMSKEVRNVIHIEGLSKRVIEYAAKDVKYLSIIKEKQLVLLKEKNLLRALDLDNKFVCVLAYVEFSGFKLSEDKWRIKIDKDNNTLANAIIALDKWIIDNEMTDYISHQLDMFNDEIKTVINWSSSKQVIGLFKELDIDTKVVDKHTGLMKNSVDAKVLAPQASKFPIIPIYTNYQKAAKLVSTYGEGILEQINPQTGRIHTSFRQLMDTGRMSCGGDDAINLQNIPADEAHRSCFIPEEGNKMIVSDYSGQESVVFANFSKDPEIIAFYEQGMGDMHSFIASKIYPELEGLTMSEIKTNHKNKRQNAKSAGFAIQYGGVGATISGNLNLTPEEGEAIYNGYFKAFPGIKDYFAKCKRQALTDGYVSLNQVSMRKSFIDFFDRYKELEKTTKGETFWDDYRSHKQQDTEMFKTHFKPVVKEYFKFKGMIERKSLNYPIQGSSAEITKFAALKFYNILLDRELLGVVKICNIVHDEIVVECPENIAEYVANTLQKCMEDAGKPFCKIIPLKAEPCITDHWEH